MTANETVTRSKTTGTNGDMPGAASSAASTARDIASGVAERAAAAASHLPEAASATGASLERAAELVRSESDEVLAIGTSLSLGMAMGLLLGGANRILVVLALIPATAMGYTLFDRHGGKRPYARIG